MNTGTYLVEKNFFDTSTLAALYRSIDKKEWKPTWENKAYAGNHWMTIPLIVAGKKSPAFERFSDLGRIVEKFKCPIKDMMFYALFPGGDIHPHRDMVGAVGIGGLRFHIPIITNDKVDFKVSGKRVIMNPGELWALDTSFLHKVSNFGSEERVHLVFDVNVNEWVTTILPPRNHRYYIHQLNLMYLMAYKAMKTILFSPGKIKGNLKVARNVYQMVSSKIRRTKKD